MPSPNRQRVGKTCGKTRMRTPNKEVWNGDYKCINIEYQMVYLNCLEQL